MFEVTIKQTQNPSILKFEFPDFISYGSNYEFQNIDQTASSPLAKKLFYFPFVKTVYISGNFIAIERFTIVEWPEVEQQVKEEIETFIKNGGKVLVETQEKKAKKIPISIYAESTPNPAVLKFVTNKLLTKTSVEYKNIDQTSTSLLAKELFSFAFVKEVFIDENYISITKYDTFSWDAITVEIRTFVKEFMENGGKVIEESMLESSITEKQKDIAFDALDTTSQQIVNIIEEYIKPAVASDGGNIAFQSFNPETKKVNVLLQGACSGCPSSTFTLKNGIENMLKEMLKDQEIIVEAQNA